MKMAKPNPRDIAAAEELMQLLQAIDGRFGGPFGTFEAPDDLPALLEDEEQSFECNDDLHLKTLYNHLARLLRNAPNFYGRVLGGMLYVILYDQNEIVDPAANVIELHPKIRDAMRQADLLKSVGLVPFALELLRGAGEGGSFDGADIQSMGVRHGLLQVEERQESCGEHCVCAEYGFPSECHRIVPQLLQAEPKAAEGQPS